MTIYRDCFQHLYGIERKRIAATPPNTLRLHRLERPDPWQQELTEKIWSTQPPINFYPDYTAFHERVSRFAGVPKENLVLGAGIEDFIRLLVMLSCDRGDGFAYLWPTCAMFGIYAAAFGAWSIEIATNPVSLPTVDVLVRSARDAKLMILANPGQPVETYYHRDELRAVAIACQNADAVFAIDEAYFGFGAPSALPLITEFDNVLVLRTFSKAFGGAGLRVGYAIGQDRTLKPLDAIRESGEVAGPSMHAANVLMDCWQSHVIPGIAEICDGRDWLRASLESDGYKASGRHANHVLIDLGDPEEARAIGSLLWTRGVRTKFDFPAPVDRHMLVTCGTLSTTRAFYQAFVKAHKDVRTGAAPV